MQQIDSILTQYRLLSLDRVLNYNKFYQYAITHHSTGIEGSSLTTADVGQVLDNGLLPKGKPLIHSLMVKDHHKALLFTIESAAQKKPLTTEFIQQINAHVMQQTGSQQHTVLGTVNSAKGDFRKSSVSAGGHYFPAYQKVEALTAELVLEINRQLAICNTLEKQLELSFAAHCHLVNIHPFYDGNGRTSRLLMNYLQHYFGLPLAIVPTGAKQAYFNALNSSREKQSLTPFISFMLTCYKKFIAQQVHQYQPTSGVYEAQKWHFEFNY